MEILAGDELPFNDTFFTVAGSDISLLQVYILLATREDQSTFTYVFTESGSYTIGAAIMDGLDSSGDSYLAVDNFKLTESLSPPKLRIRIYTNSIRT